MVHLPDYLGLFGAALLAATVFPFQSEVVLLLSWVPVIGDPLTIVAGVLREPFSLFLALVVVAKTARYLAAVALSLEWI